MPSSSPSLDRIFQALTDPTRRVILNRLSHGNASVSELAQPLDMTLAAVVQHVQVLEESGVITTQKVGRVRNCHIEAEILGTAERWIRKRRARWERRLDHLGKIQAEDNDRISKRTRRTS
jgi:DNA-binding transcriptional ArsR family regulator